MSDRREIHDSPRMTDVEALMWNLEKDPHLAASIANLTILDRSPDQERLRGRMERATAAVARLHQRVVPALGRLAPPEWREDPDFDLDFHLRHIALPEPGSMRQLLDLTASVVNDSFDRTRPLWEFLVIDGLEGGRTAMLQKLHHSITDGIGGLRMSEQFIDLTRDAVEPMAPLPPPAEPVSTTLAETALDTLSHNLRRSVGVVQRSLASAAGVVTDPPRVVGLANDGIDLARSAMRQIAVTDPARSPLWATRTLRRRLEVLRVPFDDARTAAKALGGSLNDLFVTAAAGGAGAYHRALGSPVDELRMAMPVNTRTDASAGGNAFTPTRVLVPAGIEDPEERFAAIRERVSTIRSERALGLVGATAGFANLLPTSVAVRIARQQVETVDFTTSNVRGAPFPLYIAGARMVANYPIGPTGGTAWNLTLMSSDGNLDMGLHIDTGAVTQPELLRQAIEDEFAALIAAGSGAGRRRSKRASKRPKAHKQAAAR